jgi:tetratricopeptide (TPR) repeat protein
MTTEGSMKELSAGMKLLGRADAAERSRKLAKRDQLLGEARERIGAVARAEPGSADAWYCLGVVMDRVDKAALMAGQVGEADRARLQAVGHFRETLRLDDGFAPAYSMLGAAIVRHAGAAAKAERHAECDALLAEGIGLLRKGIELHPEDTAGDHFYLGSALLMQADAAFSAGDLSRASKIVREAVASMKQSKSREGLDLALTTFAQLDVLKMDHDAQGG